MRVALEVRKTWKIATRRPAESIKHDCTLFIVANLEIFQGDPRELPSEMPKA